MKKLLELKIKNVAILYILIDIICMGMGMGVPFFCILLGFPLGWYITKRVSVSTEQHYQKYYKIFKVSLLAAIFTFILMLVVWGWTIPKIFDPSFDFQNFGLPNFLYEPKISFIGWHILMIIISPFLQLLTTIFTAFITLIRNEKKSQQQRT
jgi:O-antigen/teichoic acid export membrane protein